MNIFFAILTALLITAFADLGLSYHFDGYGLMPELCLLAITVYLVVLAAYSYVYGYTRSYS